MTGASDPVGYCGGSSGSCGGSTGCRRGANSSRRSATVIPVGRPLWATASAPVGRMSRTQGVTATGPELFAGDPRVPAAESVGPVKEPLGVAADSVVHAAAPVMPAQ